LLLRAAAGSDDENYEDGPNEHGARYTSGTPNAATNVMFWLMLLTVIVTSLIAFSVTSRN
jgi:hypothetical protein